MLKVNTSSTKLYIFYPDWSSSAVRIKGLPLATSEAIIQDSPSKNGYAGSWCSYYPLGDDPPQGKHILLDELFLQTTGRAEPNFDFLGVSHRVKCFSEQMWDFIKGYLTSDNEFDMSKLTLVNKSGKVFNTNKKYVAVRFLRDNDDLIDFGASETLVLSPYGDENQLIYPYMKIKSDTYNNIFCLKDPLLSEVFDPSAPQRVGFSKTLIITERLRNHIIDKGFVTLPMYELNELHTAFDYTSATATTSTQT